MDLEYDQKFEEMKKYIPFLESMIRRLESSSTGPKNPRQAQLSKIKALRDLLMDKSKRMKLENLLKCEQVLVNLYAKVEQRDSLPGITSVSDSRDLESARHKLKTMQTHEPENSSGTLPDIERAYHRDTLPDIAPANQIEAVCTPGSKEPALFQRRQNQSSPSMKPTETASAQSSQSASSKRNYTRVLVSPDRDSARFSLTESDSAGQPLFQRRDPNKPKLQYFTRRSPIRAPSNRRSPIRAPSNRQSPSHQKKEKKKSSKSDKNKKKSKTKKLNITLKVPQESLDSLNTENIFDRIINCDDTDVDIGMLRELRSQILGELKETGSNEDISDLILKSYRKKNKTKNAGDVEEGELSDSESEAIDNIYGSLVIVENDNKDSKTVNTEKVAAENSAKSRNIQIRLVISENDKPEPVNKSSTNDMSSENESKDNIHLEEVVPKPIQENQSTPKKSIPTDEELNKSLENTILNEENSDKSDSQIIPNNVDDAKNDLSKTLVLENSEKDLNKEPECTENMKVILEDTEKKENKANFYNPIPDTESAHENKDNNIKECENIEKTTQEIAEKVEPANIESPAKEATPKKEEQSSPKIPFISDASPKVATPKKDIVSEIDILQALKNEILSETIAIPGAEVITPALHQPKITGKVTNAQEIVKKKISLEHYKKKAVNSPNATIFKNKAKKIMNLEDAKKIRLTEKELERFNVPSRLSLDDYSSDEEEPASVADIDPNDVYKDLAPRSPDHENNSDTEKDANPVIIPVEPVKTLSPAVAKGDIDMRSLSNASILKNSPLAEGNKSNEPMLSPQDVNPSRLVDPRIRKEIGNSPLINPGGTPRPLHVPLLNMTPNSRTFDGTPSHSFDSEKSSRKHVYAPSFNSWDRDDRESSVAKETSRVWDRASSSIREGPTSSRWEGRHREQRDPRRRDDGYIRCDGSTTPSHYFGRGDCPSTPSHPFGRADPPRTPVHPFGRTDCPTTPVHPFGRGDAPTTPSHPFGRSECPNTPVHPFGRGDCPPTPNHPFGMNEAPRTPSHPFGRSDFQQNHLFGRSEAPGTPSHQFGRSGGYDPRNKRDSRNKYNDGPEIGFTKDRNFYDNRNSFEKDKNRHSNSYNKYSQDIVGRNDRDYYHRESNVDRKREPSAGRYDKKYDSSRYETRRPHHERDDSVPVLHPYRESSRGPSDGRYDRDRAVVNSVSIEPDAGRSFTIDTSVNATFQGASLSKSVSNFDDRRKRASSVGRTLTRETSVGRTTAADFNPSYNKRFYTNKLSTPFIRARSVGREIVEVQPERNFKDIKAHFDTYKAEALAAKTDSNEKSVQKTKEQTKSFENVRANTPTPPIKSRDPRSRKEAHDLQHSNDRKKDSYSPRKNMRDPRVRKEQNSVSEERRSKGNDGNPYNKYKIDNRRSDSRDKNFGIIYTNDNIAKGNILGPGSGVKNYKIPKIKRPEPEIPPEPEKPPEPVKIPEPKNISKGDTSFKPQEEPPKPQRPPKKNKVKNYKPNKVTSANENVEKQLSEITNNRKGLLESSENSTSIKTRKSKKNVISDSESDEAGDSMNVLLSKSKHDDKKTASPKTLSKTVKPIEPDPVPSFLPFENTEDISNDISFPFDSNDTDVDLFSENIASDTVIDNINDLIANLDKDIGTNKNENDLLTPIAKGNTFESILESIKSADISNLLTDNMPETALEQTVPAANLLFDNLIKNTVSAEDLPQKDLIDVEANKQTDLTKELNSTAAQPEIGVSKGTETIDIKESCEAIVSTSNTEKTGAEQTLENDVNTIPMNKDTDLGSTPDSTIDIDQPTEKSPEVKKDGVPDSTNQSHTEMHPDISSTHDSHDQAKKAETPASEKATNPLGSILSLLQDKSKINEFLSMLDDGEESEKIKKKLVKLSQLVSDDEDETTNKETSAEETKTKDDKSNKEQVDEVVANEPIENDVQEKDLTVEVAAEEPVDKPAAPKKPKRVVKKVGIKRKGIGGRFKKKSKPAETEEKKRVTRSVIQKPKRQNRELQNLQNDIRDMFISNDIINATGIRMCRLAKLAEEKAPTSSEEISPVKTKISSKKNDTESDSEEPRAPQGSGPKVILEKCPVKLPEQPVKVRKKPGPKPKTKHVENAENAQKAAVKYKPGPKSKRKVTNEPKADDNDPYTFDDSVSDTTKTTTTTPPQSDYDSEDESLASSQSFGSTELLVEMKTKNKRKRKGGWQAGVIKKQKRKQPSTEMPVPELKENTPETALPITRPSDLDCFTDKSYCFLKRVTAYECRLCNFEGEGIVNHYKNNHPHYEIPLSRMNVNTAGEAIKQSMITNFQALSKTPMSKYVCRFCYMVFSDKRRNLLEEFFWHVVNNHTGEFEQKCSLCVDPMKCTFMLDIPPTPKNMEGLLMGYICGKCNYTQVSLENLKNHVSLRHNDEETEVYSISLGVLSYVMINALKSKNSADEARSLRSQRARAKSSEPKDEDKTKPQEAEILPTPPPLQPSQPPQPTRSVKSKISFETDEFSELSKTHDEVSDSTVKSEKEDDDHNFNDSEPHYPEPEALPVAVEVPETRPVPDIFQEPHFRMKFMESGAKEYVCCINGTVHYKTTLLISMKKHVQLKHSADLWDGYCSVCKVIVMPQGFHKFTECLLHLLDKHIDNFPVADKTCLEALEGPEKSVERASPKPYINVRPISELIVPPQEADILPKIESVMSLNTEAIPNPLSEEILPMETQTEESFVSIDVEKDKTVFYEYEEFQQSVMSKKHRIVLDAMLTPEKLCHVFKCSGKFCSFSCDLAEDALDHIMTHQRVGGAGVLQCCYCSFDASGNAIDLVTHTFNEHGRCKYTCKCCFYRAITSSLVGVHCARRHPELTTASPKVLAAFGISATTQDNEGILGRNEAVDYYCCSYMDADSKCKFKTFTSGKFVEHLEGKHPDVLEHTCGICSEAVATPSSLVSHLASHGLKLYQCVWCKFGADSERALLDHDSVVHPTKRPQAYLRHIIETLDSTSSVPKLKVLPLVHIGRKLEMESQNVPQSTNRENAKREAERAFELEKLIGHTTQIIEGATHAPENAEILEATNDEAIDPPEETIIPDLRELPRETTPPREPTPIEPPPVKKEPTELINKSNISVQDVICLDSDEEEPNTSTEIDQSAEKEMVIEENSPRVAQSQLYKCGRCQIISKSGSGMKRHILYCYPQNIKDPEMKCAFCQYTNNNRDTLVMHTKLAHGPLETLICTMCPYQVTEPSKMKEHLQTTHKVNRVLCRHVIKKTNKPETPEKSVRKQSRRKRSTTETPPVTPSKLKRYGPDEINLLPINQILEELVQCSLCEYSTKVRLNMVRHLQLHGQREPVPEIAPVNPVPHLETNEMHFDRMVNLASSSAVNKTQDKGKESTPLTHIAPELAARYPKHIAERKRYACGAKNCTYISIDEAMLKCHWETLHSGSSEYHCVHCPPNQQLDTSRPLTAVRIIAHLKMHDVKLYACSSCSYYHHLIHLVEKHLNDKHNGNGSVKIVRDGNSPPAPQVSTSAPTMDLKPWQCGLCNFKSMLRPQVVEHCAKNHNSKFQFKCAFCPWRTSAIENVKKHHMTSHNQEAEEFYFYYREGSLPDEKDGTPRWMKQRLAAGLPAQTEVKTEDNPEPTPSPAAKPAPAPVNLNLVKTEPDEEESLESLCAKFGAICDPNGLKFKCPLCKICEDDKEAMRSHLYEELKYRKWGCIFCSYKAFHKTGLKEHAYQEHHNSEDLATELPSDPKIETWVTKVLEHQEKIISTSRDNLRKSLEVPSSSKTTPQIIQATEVELPSDNTYSDAMLANAFGPFGSSANGIFACPKCEFKIEDEVKMKEHLEMELAKVRWCCSACPAKFQNYHQAQLHCKSSHIGGSGARASEALRDAGARAAWLRAVLRAQGAPGPVRGGTPPPEDNSLLMVRYEQSVPTPECRKRPADDSDDERLVIDEPPPKKTSGILQCKYCETTCTMKNSLDSHILRHYNMKPYACVYCDFTGHYYTILKHIENFHPGLKREAIKVQIPDRPPDRLNLNDSKTTEVKVVGKFLTCLICEQNVPEKEAAVHSHPYCKSQFAERGDVVYKCCICLRLRINLPRMRDHFRDEHPFKQLNYAFFKLHVDSREMVVCMQPNCLQRFTFVRDLKSHHVRAHGAAELNYVVNKFSLKDLPEATDTVSVKRVAKKSTTKLPTVLTVARKSTTKLPFYVYDEEDESEVEDYSYYGTKPQSLASFSNVTTKMAFMNTVMPFSLQKLSEIVNLSPQVRVKDCQK